MQITEQITDAIHKYFERCLPDIAQHRHTTEYELIQYLQDADIEPFNVLRMSDVHHLFQAHFLVRHALYYLQRKYYDMRAYHLVIEITKLTRTPWQPDSSKGLTAQLDSVRDYYMDLNNLQITTSEEVNNLLNSFWNRYLANNHKADALRMLGLEPDADFKSARRQYRKLAQQLHPDKGGDPAEFQAILEAITTLENCHKGSIKQ